MADEHFFPTADFSSGLGALPPFFGSGHYAPQPPPGLDVAACAAAMAPFGMLQWASAELPLPSESAATTTAHFDSALSSLVSSPAHAGGGDDVAAIGDLIGRLGSICSNAAASANNSCYSTPLSSPPRVGASPAAAMAAFRQGSGCYLEAGGGGRMSRVASSKSLGGATPVAMESAAEVETSPATAAGKAEAPAKGGDASSAAARKRKVSGKGKTEATVETASPKRPKVVGDGGEDIAAADDAKKPEPVKDYIHVRARRGQATDSHSLAERVRREKISERMKLLQSLVPGCNKITGKALMLDEIINYVQSLQRQVEFLSMKLSTMNPQLDVDAPQYLPSDKDVMMHHPTAMLGYPHHDAFSYAGAMHHPTMEPPCAGGFNGWDAAAQDLQSIVQQLPSPSHGFHGGQQQEAATVSHMKVEP